MNDFEKGFLEELEKIAVESGGFAGRLGSLGRMLGTGYDKLIGEDATRARHWAQTEGPGIVKDWWGSMKKHPTRTLSEGVLPTLGRIFRKRGWNPVEASGRKVQDRLMGKPFEPPGGGWYFDAPLGIKLPNTEPTFDTSRGWVPQA